MLEQLQQLNGQLRLGQLLCTSREPDFLLDILHRQGPNQSMPWLSDLVENNEGAFRWVTGRDGVLGGGGQFTSRGRCPPAPYSHRCLTFTTVMYRLETLVFSLSLFANHCGCFFFTVGLNSSVGGCCVVMPGCLTVSPLCCSVLPVQCLCEFLLYD